MDMTERLSAQHRILCSMAQGLTGVESGCQLWLQSTHVLHREEPNSTMIIILFLFEDSASQAMLDQWPQ